MASETLRLYQPIHIESVDEAAHTAGSGYPTHSHLGVRLARADRTMHGYFRRAGSVAFAQNQVGTKYVLPVAREVLGLDLGLWQWLGTPGVTEGEWYIIAQADVGHEAWVQAYNLGLVEPPAPGDRSGATHIVGTGAPATYGPFPCRLLPGPNLIGVIISSGMDAAPVLLGDVIGVPNPTTVLVNDGELGPWTPSGGPVVAFYRQGESSAGGNEPLDGLHQIDRAGREEAGGIWLWLDSMSIWPPVSRDMQILAGYRVGPAPEVPPVVYELSESHPWTLLNVTHRELPQTNLLGSTAVGYIPIPDESAFSRGRFVASPLGALMDNARHLAATRGRMAVCAPYQYGIAWPGVWVETARVQTDATPEERFYEVSLIFDFSDASPSGQRYDWRVTVTDTTGAAPLVSEVFTDVVDRAEGAPDLHRSRRLPDPKSEERASFAWQFATQWRRVAVDPACPAVGRMLIIEVQSFSLVLGAWRSRLAGFFAVGGSD